MLTLEVQNFGPLKSAKLELRPMTVITGPNNSGKSYLASVFHTLVRVLANQMTVLPVVDLEPPSDLESRLRELYIPLGERGGAQANLDELSLHHRELVMPVIDSLQSNFASIPKTIEAELERTFLCRISELRRTPRARMALRISRHRTSTDFFDLGFNLSGSSLALEESARATGRVSLWSDPKHNGDKLIVTAQPFLRSEEWHRSYYFPAARTGLLQSYRAVASLVLRRYGLRQTETTPLFGGLVADFIGDLAELQSSPFGNALRQAIGVTPITAIASYLESEILGGRAEQSADALGEILYYRGDRIYPVQRVSSMVTELAPVVLFLKHAISPGQIVIVEEPEAHLHPENQRKFARALARLANAGVHVLMTTHSDYFVQQLANCVQATAVPQNRAEKLGIMPEELLTPDSIAVYSTVLDKDGYSSLHRQEVTAEEGIPDEGFSDVAVDLSNQSARLQLEQQ